MQEKRDKIKLGLVEPAAPKVKVANMVSVLGTDALINPSRAEQVCLSVCLSSNISFRFHYDNPFLSLTSSPHRLFARKSHFGRKSTNQTTRHVN